MEEKDYQVGDNVWWFGKTGLLVNGRVDAVYEMPYSISWAKVVLRSGNDLLDPAYCFPDRKAAIESRMMLLNLQHNHAREQLAKTEKDIQSLKKECEACGISSGQSS